MNQPAARTIYRVSELVTSARELLEASFPLLWVEGEVSNLARPRSGHWYFTLKDSAAQVRCAMFANRNRAVVQPPKDGDLVLVRARVSLYAARGEFQLIVESLEDAGEGALKRAFEQTRDRLAAEGLFEQSLKRPLPEQPACIGVITSATGAALRDVLAVLARRYPLARVLLVPVPVQGAAAPAAIAGALAHPALARRCDVALLVRGGGSLEDLQAFNEESVARALRACPVPVVAGIGHEVDVTIADFAADLRAPTPSAAAELVCPDLGERLLRAAQLRQRAAAALARRLQDCRAAVLSHSRRLQRMHPARRMEQRMQRVDELEQRLRRCVRWQAEGRRARLAAAQARLAQHDPRHLLARQTERLVQSRARLARAATVGLAGHRQRWRLALRGLEAVSPLATLARGYAIAQDAEQTVIRDAAAVRPGDAIGLRLRRGHLECRVDAVHPQVPTKDA